MPPPPPPQRPPLHSNSHPGPLSSSSSLPILQIPVRTNIRRGPRRQRYNTLAVTDDDDDDVGTIDIEQQQQAVVEVTTITNDIDDTDDDDDTTATDSGSRNRHSRRPPPLYAALPTTTNSNSNSNSNNNNSSTSVSSIAVVMEVTILDFTHKRWPIQITTEHMTNNNNNKTNRHHHHPQEPTVYDLKHIGATVHHIPIYQQRLIYQGKLLNDDQISLSSLGIQPHGSIVHLFPKPRVVVVDTAMTTTSTPDTTSTHNNEGSHPNDDHHNNNSNSSNSGAHVPVIVMEQSEVDRRSEILVLGHADYVEAVSNVKLFSLMLLIISTIELLHLLSLYITPQSSSSNNNGHSYYNNNNQNNNNYYGDNSYGVPHIQEDDHFFNDDQYNSSSNTSLNNSSSTTNTNNVIDTITAGGANAIDPIDEILDVWTPIKYVDSIISIIGIYVSILGMRASNENCLRTARYYLMGTTITAVAWLTYNYIISYEIDVVVDANPEKYYGTIASSESSDYQYGSSATTSDDAIGESYGNNSSNSYYNSNDSPYNQAFTSMILPGMVWGLCIFRAWQFQHVLHDAELEAAERTNTMMSMDATANEDVPSDTNQVVVSTNDRHHRNHPVTTTTGTTITLGDVELSTIRNENDDHHHRNRNLPSSTPVGTMA